MLTRRQFILSCIATLAWSSSQAHPGFHRHPHKLKPLRRRRVLGRRVRRFAGWRRIGARRYLVVPVAVAVGWELMLDGRPVVVKRVAENHIYVSDANGQQQKVDVIREDNESNAQLLEGSEYEVEE